MGLKENIKTMRKQQGKTLEDVAKFIGITRQTVQKYESGLVANIPSTTIEKMAEFFNCSPAYLMGWEDNPNVATEPARLPDEEAATLLEDEKSLVTDYRKLNTTGKDKVREYTKDLSEHERYTQKDKTTFSAPFQSSCVRTTANFEDDIERIAAFGGMFTDDDEPLIT